MYREFPPVTSIADLGHLDMADVIIGYQNGLCGCYPPTNEYSRAYWHGWNNGRVDAGQAKETPEQAALRVLIWLNSQPAPEWRI